VGNKNNMKKTVSELIYEYLKKNRRFVFGGELERNISNFHKPSYVSRELRRMAEEDLIYKDYRKVDGKRVVVYRYKKHA
jgi:Mn-dependent DtxR family transcriptional regulator